MFILKIGGGENINYDYIAEDLATSKEKFIIVHGANSKMKEICSKIDLAEKIITSPSGYSSRFTDNAVIDAMLMAYSGVINKRIVAILLKNKINAMGLSGIDGRLISGERKHVVLAVDNGKTKAIRGNYTGRVKSINTDLLNLLLNSGYVPVICTPIISEQNEIINADNDRIIANLAASMKIDKIISLFEAPGLLRNVNDEESVINRINQSEIEQFTSLVSGRMKMKIMGAVEALELGVKEVHWGDGRVKNPITNLLNEQGTLICAES